MEGIAGVTPAWLTRHLDGARLSLPTPKHMGPQPTALYHIGSYMQKKTPKNTKKHSKTHQL